MFLKQEIDYRAETNFTEKLTEKIRAKFALNLP